MRGDARVIYYCHVPGDRIYVIYGYVESRSEGLTAEQIEVLKALMRDIEIKAHFDQLVKGVREMKRHMAGKSVRLEPIQPTSLVALLKRRGATP